MSTEPVAPTAGVEMPSYARISRRVRAYLIDVIIVMAALFIVLLIASTVESDALSRTFGLAVLIAALLYEPLLVSLTGGSVGHYLSNLRVVDNRTRRNVGFLKATARMIIKAILGWMSFITMATTRRHQAIHDLLMQSTVQIRDLARAAPHHYAAERLELASPTMPSRIRRIAVIVAYLLGLLMLVFGTAGLFERSGLVSAICIVRERCSRAEGIWMNGLSLSWLALSVLCIIQGWRGRLFGCRRTRVSSQRVRGTTA